MNHVEFFPILVEPEVPENVGFIARLCANFSIVNLRVVGSDHLLKQSRTLRTAVHAQDILNQAKVFASLEEAISDLDESVGFTAKEVHSGLSIVPLSNLSVSGRRVGLIFGCENHGLSNQQLHLCNQIVTIPTSSQYPSLNLSHSVGIVLFWLNHSNATLLDSRQSSLPAPAMGINRDRAHQMWQSLASEVGFSHEQNANHVSEQLRQLVTVCSQDESKIQLLMGLAHQIRWALGIQNSIPETDPLPMFSDGK